MQGTLIGKVGRGEGMFKEGWEEMGEGVGRRWEGEKEWEKVGGREGMGEGVGRRGEGKKKW